MPEAPPIHLPGAGYLLPDGTHVTQRQLADAVDRVVDLCARIERLFDEIGGH